MVRSLAQNLTGRVFDELERIAFQGSDDRTRLAALQVILDRGWGKPAQALESEGAGGPITVRIVRFGDDEAA